MLDPSRLDLPPAAVVYGAGSFGIRLASDLADLGVRVLAIIDRAAENAAGFELRRLDDVDDLLDVPVFLGICNPGADPSGIECSLSRLGFADVRSPVEGYAALHAAGVHRTNYWLTGDVGLYRREAARVDRLRTSLADPRSQQLLDAWIAYRSTGRSDRLPRPDPPHEIYLPADLPIPTAPVRLFDVGAFDGDTLRVFREAGRAIEWVIAFEPDPENYIRLVQAMRDMHVAGIALPLGVDAQSRLARFTASANTAAAFDSAGDVVVQTVALDDLVHDWRPTYVKMDIEGAELAALNGMRRLLRDIRPQLAVSVYHRPADLWEIPEFIAGLDLGYRFHLRGHAHQCFDTVLYAVPEE